MLRAIEEYDYENPQAKFSTYASYWIWSRVNRYSNYYCKGFRYPEYIIQDLDKCNRFVKRWQAENNTSEIPSIQVVKEKLELTQAFYENFSTIVNKTYYLSAPITGESDITLEDTLTDENAVTDKVVIQSELYSELRELLPIILNPSELEVITKRFDLNNEDVKYTLEELAQERGFTREWLRQIQNKALEKLSRNKDVRQLARDLLT